MAAPLCLSTVARCPLSRPPPVAPGRPAVVVAPRGFGRFVRGRVQRAACRVVRFPNGELVAHVDARVEGAACVVIGSIAPPEARLAAVTLLAHTLRRAGAARVTALLPYLAYARQDVAASGQSLGLQWVGDLLRGAGVDDIATVDVHSPSAADLLAMPVRSLSPAWLLADALPAEWRREATFVAPDEGAVDRCAAVAAAAGRPHDTAHLVKRREATGVAHLALHGSVASLVLIVDDILDTGATLSSCATMLRAKGARRIAVAVTHGLFTDPAADLLRRAGVEAVWVTDSVLSRRRPTTAQVVPLAPLFAPVFRA